MPHQPTDANGDDGPQVSSHEVEETPEEILEYWTPERMAKAEPARRTLEVPDSGPVHDPKKPDD
jgi:hypothetical protein